MRLGFFLSKKIVMKNCRDYQLYNFVCDILSEAWCNEENKIAYLHYCERHKIDNKYIDNRLKCAPSLECIENSESFSRKEDGSSTPYWVRLNHINQSNTNKPVVEAIKIECIDTYIGKCFESEQTLSIDFRVRWPMSINHPVVGMVIKNHRNVILCSVNNLSFGLENNYVTAGASLSYRFKLIIPEIVSGLYKVDVQLGFGLGMQYKVTSIAEAVIAFGVKTSVSAGSDFIPIEDAKSRMKYYSLG